MDNGFNTHFLEGNGYLDVLVNGTRITVINIEGQESRILIETEKLVKDAYQGGGGLVSRPGPNLPPSRLYELVLSGNNQP